MNILILGGTGYLGAKIVRRFGAEGDNRLVCTKRKSVYPHAFSNNEKIIWVDSTLDSIMATMKGGKFDIVINAVGNYGKNLMLYDSEIEANLGFPLMVLNAAVANGIGRFLTIGTGLPANLNMYSYSKMALADMGRFYTEKHDISFYHIRPEMFYGADEPKDRFLPNIIRKMIHGEEVNTTIGTQHRDIIAAEDVVEAIYMVATSGLRGYQEISVGTGVAPTISEIIDFIWTETGKSSIVNKGAVAMRPNEPDCVADTSILKELGTWNPRPWKHGLRQMILTIEKEDKV